MNANQHEQPKMTPAEALRVLESFVTHPSVRCFNYNEFSAATVALQTLQAALAAAKKGN